MPGKEELGVEPEVDHAPRRVQEGGEARPRDQGADGTDDGNAVGSGFGPLLLGLDDPARDDPEEGRRHAVLADQGRRQFGVRGDQPSAAGSTQAEPGITPGKLVDRQHVGNAPALGDVEPGVGHRGSQDVKPDRSGRIEHDPGGHLQPSRRPREPPAPPERGPLGDVGDPVIGANPRADQASAKPQLPQSFRERAVAADLVAIDQPTRQKHDLGARIAHARQDPRT